MKLACSILLCNSFNFFQLLTKGPFSVKALRNLLYEHCYGSHMDHEHDKNLLRAILKSCINDEAILTNRYHFCAASEYFLPNKIIWQDFVEFIKVNNAFSYAFCFLIILILKKT